MKESLWQSRDAGARLTERPALGNMGAPRGAVAQLGERLNGIQEVASSILVSSTNQFHEANAAGPEFLNHRRPMSSAHGTIDGDTGVLKKKSKPEKRFGRQPLIIWGFSSWGSQQHQ